MKPCHAAKRRLLTGVWATLCACATTPVWADGFTGALVPGNFSVVNTGVIIGSSPAPGTASFTATQLTLVGSDSISPAPATDAPGCSGGVYSTLSSPCELRATLAWAGTVTFTWAYTTADAAGPGGDIFGVIVDGAHIALSSLGGAVTQGGTRSFTSASNFGWFVNCTDCITGAATVLVSNVSAVPEPASSALWLGGLAGLAGLRSALRRSAVSARRA
jgi:hypothetical protein